MELDGGAIFVKKAAKPQSGGSLQKRFYSGGEEGVIKEFYPPTYLDVVEYIPNAELSFASLADATARNADKGYARLYGVPSLDATSFKKTKDNCKNLKSLILVLDIEKDWCASRAYTSGPVSHTNLETIVEAELATSFPKHPGLGYVAKWSSSARLRLEKEELRIRVYVLLDTPIGEEERISRFAGLPTDDSVFENNQLDLIAPGVVMDRGVPVYADMPYQEVIYKDGLRLPIEDFPKIHTRKAKGGKGKGTGTTDTKLYQKIIAEHEELTGKRVKHNSPEAYDAVLAAAKAGRLEGNRFRIHYWLLLECFRREGNCYDAMAFILNNKEVLGERRGIDDLLAAEQSIAQYFGRKWNGTPIANLFKTDEILVLNSRDTNKNLDEIKQFFSDLVSDGDENQVIVDNQGIGLGKTSTTIGHFCKLYEDDRISVCYRKSILLMQCKQLGFSYYLDIPDWARTQYPNTDFSTWSEQQIKEAFLPDLSNPATTIQSLQYIAHKNAGHIENTYGLLVIDEVERVLAELYLKPELAYEEKNVMLINKQLQFLMELAYSARTVVLADADASAELTGWLVEILSRAGKKKYLIQNKEDWYRDKTFCELNTKEAWLCCLKNLLDANKTVLIHTDMGDDTEELTSLVNTIADYCSLNPEQILGLHSGKYGNPDVRIDMNTAIEAYRKRGVRCLAISPIIQIGASFTGVPHDAVMLFFKHGKAFGIDRFQNAFRDRQCPWIGFHFADSFSRTPHDTVSGAFENTPQYKPSFATDLQKELQERLKQRHLNMRENPSAAFLRLLDERGATLTQWWKQPTGLELYHAQSAFKAHDKDGRERTTQKLKENAELYKEFVALDFDKQGWSTPVFVEDFEDVPEQDLKAAARYLKNGDAKTAKAMVDLALMDEELIKETAEGERLAYMVLQGALLRQVNNVFARYLPDNQNLFQVIQKRGFCLDFHVDGTPEAKAFIDFARLNRNQLDLAALLELQGWKDSPHKIIEKSFQLLGYDTELLEKRGGKSGSSKLACVWRDDLYRQYLKEKVIKSEQNKTRRKWLLLSVLRTKRMQGLELTQLEENFYRSVGRTLIVRPRAIMPLRTWLTTAVKASNPNAIDWIDHFESNTALP